MTRLRPDLSVPFIPSPTLQDLSKAHTLRMEARLPQIASPYNLPLPYAPPPQDPAILRSLGAAHAALNESPPALQAFDAALTLLRVDPQGDPKVLADTLVSKGATAVAQASSNSANNSVLALTLDSRLPRDSWPSP